MFSIEKSGHILSGNREQIQDSREFPPVGPLKGPLLFRESDLLLSMCPHNLRVRKFLTLRHVDAYLGIGNVPILCPYLEFLLLGSQFASRAGPHEP